MTRSAAYIVLLLATQSLLAQSQPFDWKSAKPEDRGLSTTKLDAMRATLAARGTKTLLIIRNERIVYEWYAPDSGADKPHYTASMAKALVGGMSLSLAMQDGRIKPDDLACQYIPEWKTDPRKSKITIRHLATHSSGIQDAEHEGQPHEQLPGWMGAFWKRQPDPFTISRDQAPVIFAPGEKFHYSNPGMAMLAYAVTASLKGTPHQDIRTLLRERIMRPIGVPDKEWSVGYGQTYKVNGLDLVANWGGGGFTTRATARVGRLMLRKGNWDGKQLLDPAIVQQCTAYAKTPLPDRTPTDPAPGSGLAWWTNFDGVWKSVPRDAFCGAGAGTQVLIVIPSLDMIIVRNGGNLHQKNETFWAGVETYLLNPLMQSITPPQAGAQRSAAPDLPAPQPTTPYPPSPVIRSITFDPISSITRKAIGSDNWPITWADDDHLYTSYGDGWGFEPRIKPKLSQGFARIEGTPADFRGINIRSESGERLGDGAKGAKASGLLMVDGVLYMWVRNTATSTLCWSTDHGKTWEWGFKFDTSFGCPTFLNFGRNYAGNDGYVYIYSHDGPSAYEPSDGLVLARVHKDKLRSWTRIQDSGFRVQNSTPNLNPEPRTLNPHFEFFLKLDPAGQPLWTPDITRRGHVFSYPNHCERTEVIYNPALKRYLLALGFGHGKGWGIFDALNPWGPWTTAFHTQSWDIPETHGYRLPTKWISPDGLTMHLLFSGRNDYDAFCLRRFTIQLH